MKIAILDDYQSVSSEMADWSAVSAKADITVFTEHITDPEALIERLAPFTILCVMRERTPLSQEILGRLPRLKLIASTGTQNRSIDLSAASDHNIEVTYTRYSPVSTIELTWALVLASARNLLVGADSVRSGGWQRRVGDEIRGKVLGILGLGNIGSEVANIARAFGMSVIAWSENLDPEKARKQNVHWVPKQELFQQADIITIHLILSDRTRGLVGRSELGLMKRSARLVNTSRGPIVDEAALVDALRNQQIAAAVIDVFDVEPLPPDHPLRQLDNVITTPHIGLVSRDQYRVFYQDTVTNIEKWMQRTPV